MKRSKVLYKTTIAGYHTQKGSDIYLSVVGIFDTEKAFWDYFVTSFFRDNNMTYITNDIKQTVGTDNVLNNNNIYRYGKKVNSINEGKLFIDDYKIKWETGLNNTLQEKRDKILSDILNDEKDIS